MKSNMNSTDEMRAHRISKYTISVRNVPGSQRDFA